MSCVSSIIDLTYQGAQIWQILEILQHQEPPDAGSFIWSAYVSHMGEIKFYRSTLETFMDLRKYRFFDRPFYRLVGDHWVFNFMTEMGTFSPDYQVYPAARLCYLQTSLGVEYFSYTKWMKWFPILA